MGAETTTRFRLIDAAALVGATAAGLALGRGGVAWERGTARDAAADYAVSLALAWTLAVLALNLTRYRAPRRELVCRPGFSAALAVAVERSAEFVYAAVVMPFDGQPRFEIGRGRCPDATPPRFAGMEFYRPIEILFDQRLCHVLNGRLDRRTGATPRAARAPFRGSTGAPGRRIGVRRPGPAGTAAGVRGERPVPPFARRSP